MTAMPKLKDLENSQFDPFVIEQQLHGDTLDPYPHIHALMRGGPVVMGSYRDQFTDVPDVQMGHLPQAMVLGYDAVQHVLTHPELFGNEKAQKHTLGQMFGHTITVMDAPEHTQYRKVFQRAFLPNVVAKWGETVVDPVVSSLLDEIISRGEGDLVEEFTHHYPFQVIYRQLELDADQARIFHKLAVAQMVAAIGVAEGAESTVRLGEFFAELLEMRRSKPGTDLVSHLAATEVDGERLPDDVLISFLRQLLNAGGDTTYRGTSVLLTALLTHPEQLAAVAADRSLIPQAIDEALRWDGPVSTTFRYAERDTEIMGAAMPAGTYINTVIASANRDPAKFENPDSFDIFRKSKFRHLAFASGPHVCIGQHLARIEMIRALNALLDRMPNLRLNPDKPQPRILGHILRVPEHIWVRFG